MTPPVRSLESPTEPAYGDRPLGTAVRRGAAAGAGAWLVYAVAEVFFSSVAPWLSAPSYSYTPVHRGLTLLLFVVYPAIGAIAGGALAALLRALAGVTGFPRWSAPVLGTLTVVIAFDLNLLHLIFLAPFSFEASNLHLIQPLALSVVPITASLAALASPAWSRRLRFVTSPWTASFLLTGLPWLTVHALSGATRGPKTVGVIAFPAAVLLIAFVVRRVTIGKPTRVPAVLATLVTLVTALLVDHTAHELGPAPPVPAGRSSAPNVLLIVMDTVRADHVSLYGYARKTTPNLEELAGRATVYRRSVASGDMTLTTHASLFTGLYGRTHGAHRSPMTPAGRPLDASFLTLAEMLETRGYWNAAVVANRGYVTPHFGFDQGFHSFDSRGPVPFLGTPAPYYLRRGVRAALIPFAPRAAFDRVVRSAEDINREAMAQLGRMGRRGGPFFLFVNYMDAHNPYLPPAPFDTMFPGKDPTFNSVRYGRLMWEMNKRGLHSISERDRAHITSQYDGGIAYEDAQIARLLARLEELGLYDDTLVVITADHGEALGDRFLVNHGVSVYQDQVGVPLIVKYPGQTRGEVVDAWTSSVDLLPTVLDVLELPLPEGLPGRSLPRLLPDEDRAVVAESFPTGAQARFHRMERALYEGTHKLIVNTEGKRELYDLTADPSETTNLFEEDVDAAEDLQARLETWLAETVERSDSTAAAELDDDMRERLKALGYVE